MVKWRYGRRSVGELLFDGFNVILLAAVSIACAYPFVYVLFASMSDPGLLLQHRGVLLGPTRIDFEAYRMVLLDPGIGRGYANTIFVVFFGVLYNVTLTAFGAYALSRRKLVLKKLFIFMIIIPLYIQDRRKFPLQLILRQILLQNSTQRMTIDGLMTEKALYAETVKYATTIVATLPLIVAYPFLQRYFVKGLLVGSLKG
jgi:putative aldouronate transport system permease protein